jgi:hypothetical protein
MKRWLILAAGLGLVLAIAIIAYQGFGAVAEAFAAVGFGVAVVVLLRAVELAGAGLGWWIVVPAAARCPLYACVWVRFIREAINALLPVAQVGGEIAGVRLMTFFGIAGEVAGATVLVDILMQALTLLLFTLVGIGILATVVADRALVGVAGTAIMGLALAGFFVAQRFGGAKLFDRFDGARGKTRLVRARQSGKPPRQSRAYLCRLAAAPRRHIGSSRRLVRRRPRSAGGAAADGISSFVRGGAGDRERWPGATRRCIPDAGRARRSGEAGFIAVCTVFGIPAAEALALSLVKRVPDITLGLPFLLVWHAHEAKALIRRRPARS